MRSDLLINCTSILCVCFKYWPQADFDLPITPPQVWVKAVYFTSSVHLFPHILHNPCSERLAVVLRSSLEFEILFSSKNSTCAKIEIAVAIRCEEIRVIQKQLVRHYFMLISWKESMLHVHGRDAPAHIFLANCLAFPHLSSLFLSLSLQPPRDQVITPPEQHANAPAPPPPTNLTSTSVYSSSVNIYPFIRCVTLSNPIF